jgi:ketosteroid isomerase-like protein
MAPAPVRPENATVHGLFDILAAFNTGDLARLAERVDPDVVYRIPGRASVSGEFRGVEAVIAAFGRLRRESGGTITAEPEAVLADADTVMFTARVTAEREGRTLDVVNAYLFRFRAGRLVEGRLFPGDLHAIEAFFPPRP